MLLDKFKLDGKVAVVTGAGKGIGRGIALGFAEAGAHVVCAARTQADIDDTAREAAERGPEAVAVACDVTDTGSLHNLAKRALEAFGRVDVLVNNAGGTGPRPALKTSEAFFEAALRFNATSAFLLSQRLAPMMVETAGGGAIVNISSRCADLAQGAFVAYGAGKAALNMMTRNMAIEFAPKVRVNAIGVAASTPTRSRWCSPTRPWPGSSSTTPRWAGRARPRTSPPARCTWPRRRRPG